MSTPKPSRSAFRSKVGAVLSSLKLGKAKTVDPVHRDIDDHVQMLLVELQAIERNLAPFAKSAPQRYHPLEERRAVLRHQVGQIAIVHKKTSSGKDLTVVMDVISRLTKEISNLASTVSSLPSAPATLENNGSNNQELSQATPPKSPPQPAPSPVEVSEKEVGKPETSSAKEVEVPVPPPPPLLPDQIVDGLPVEKPNDPRTEFDNELRRLESRFVKLRKQDPDAHVLVDKAFEIHRTVVAGNDFAAGIQQFQELALAIDGRLVELKGKPRSIDERAEGVKRRINQLVVLFEEKYPEDAADARKLSENLSKDQAEANIDPDQALALAQKALEKMETLFRRAVTLEDAFHRESKTVAEAFNELKSKAPSIVGKLTDDLTRPISEAEQLGHSKRFRAAVAELDRVQKRLRSALDRKTWEDRIGDISLLKNKELQELGRAGNGVAFLVKGTDANGPELVAKVPYEYVGDDAINREAAIYDQIGEHPNLARCLGVIDVTVTEDQVDPNKGGAEFLAGNRKAIVLERLSGTVRDAQKKLKDQLKSGKITQAEYWGTVQYTLSSILEGFNHLANRGLVHGDFKDDNVMYDADTGAVKLIDLGEAFREKTPPGTGAPLFQPPERIRANKESATEADFDKVTGKVDVFALGGMLYGYGEGKDMPQYDDKQPDNQRLKPLEQGKTYKTGDDAGKYGAESEYVKFVNWALNPDPDKRPSAREALEHPFLRDRLLNDEEAGNMLKKLHKKTA